MSGLIKGIVELSTPDVYAAGDVAPLLVDVNGRALTSMTIGGIAPAMDADNADAQAVSALLNKLVVLSRLEGFNGTAYDRLRSEGNDRDAVPESSLGNLQTINFGHVFDSSATDWNRIREANADGKASTGLLAAAGMLFNETTFDRQRNNTVTTALASAARTTTTTSPDQENHNATRIIIILAVSVNPGSAETLNILVRDKTTGNATVIASGTADAFGGTSGRSSLIVGPGVATGWSSSVGDHTAIQSLIPRDFDIQVVHSASGSWTYILQYVLVN